MRPGWELSSSLNLECFLVWAEPKASLMKYRRFSTKFQSYFDDRRTATVTRHTNGNKQHASSHRVALSICVVHRILWILRCTDSTSSTIFYISFAIRILYQRTDPWESTGKMMGFSPSDQSRCKRKTWNSFQKHLYFEATFDSKVERRPHTQPVSCYYRQRLM